MKKAQVGGSHYNQGGVQHIDWVMSNNLDHLQAASSKYIARHHRKNGAEDIRKAIHYCLFILKYDYNAVDDELIDHIITLIGENDQ